MKRLLLCTMVAAFAYVPAFSQADTTILYFGKNGRETSRDSAVSYTKFYRQANLWHGMEYYTKGNTVKSEGDYNEAKPGTAVGSVNYYKEDGKLDYTIDYADGKPLNKTYFFKSGDKRSYTVYSDKGIEIQKGWDESGRELKNFVVEREAQFKGGEDGWNKYLQKNMNRTLPGDLGLAAGTYGVQVQFTINKDGIPGNLKALSVPPKCKACGPEALRMLRESPAWEPAILNNEPIVSEITRTISFQPVGGK